MEYFYDKNRGEQIRLIDQRMEFSPFYASSGVQSALPLEVMVNALTAAVGTKANVSKSELMEIVSSLFQDTTDTDKAYLDVKIPKNLLTYQGAVFFIEELEQNLFPESQAKLLRHVVGAVKKANSKFDSNYSMVSITTHSPYVLSVLNVLMAASEAYQINPAATAKIVPEKYILPKGSIAAYYLTPDGRTTDVVDPEIYMLSGNDLDAVSQRVEEDLDLLNDIICG